MFTTVKGIYENRNLTMLEPIPIKVSKKNTHNTAF
jgi:hypothetical protein